MAQSRGELKQPAAGLTKCPTGIRGLDEITNGSLPESRPAQAYGSAGRGKSERVTEVLWT
ncbi:MAG: hypothetical protein LAO07_03300 [Acidobacteriia bacterium]|nr:hypothetical protein [Terriglobia bacterium]